MRAYEQIAPREQAILAFAIPCPQCKQRAGNPCETAQGKVTEPHRERIRGGYAKAFATASAACGGCSLSPRAALDLYEPGMSSFTLRQLLREHHPEAFARDES